MTLLAELRARRIRPAVAAHKAAAETDARALEAAQLRRLNDGWVDSLRRSPWARAIQARLRLPDRFADWESFSAAMPIQRKSDLRAILESVQDAPAEPVDWRATGGTTAEPFRFPVLRTEARIAELDHWLGRSCLRIDPADRLFLLWGHAHLFGVGLKGAIAQLKRRAADVALGYCRWSAYRLTEDALDQAATAFMGSRAVYVIGYSSALDRFARVNAPRAAELCALRVKAVIATAEAFPSAESRDRIAACFGAPVVMEYGSVETGPVAYERGDGSGGYDVFFRHHRLERGKVVGAGGATELLVTTLYPRALPLLRYAVGDAVVADPSDGAAGLTRFRRVVGRCNDVVATPSGTPIHSEAFTHVLRDLPGISAYQIVRGTGGVALRIRYEAPVALGLADETEIRRRLGLVDPSLKGLALERIDRLERSVAGKSVMLMDEARGNADPR